MRVQNHVMRHIQLMPVSRFLRRNWKKNGMFRLFNEIEMPLVFTLYDMEQAGVKIEGEELKRYGEELEQESLSWKKRFMKWQGKKFNIQFSKTAWR